MYNLNDVLEVIRYMQARDNVPTWVVGGSAATAATWNLAIHLPIDMPVGVIFFSPDHPNISQVALIKRPTFVIYHPLDTLQSGGAFFAALTSAPVREQVSLTGGSKAANCGYHGFNGLDADFVAATTGFIDKYNGSFAPSTPDLNQHGLTGSWYEPATSGQGFELEVFPNLSSPGNGSAQASWFTYDTVAGGPERQRWYTFSGPVVSGQSSSAMTIYQNTGGNFNALPVTAATAVGNATLSFSTCTSGQLTYNFTEGSGRSGTIPLTRLTQNVTCSTTSARPTNADFAFSGNWYDPATSGQGLTVEINPNSTTLFLAWYTYAPSGASAEAAGQRWYTAQPTTFVPGSRSISVQIYETTGGLFDAPTPPGQKSGAVGSGTLAFQSCSAATFSYNFTGGSSSGMFGTITLSRVGPVPPGCTP
jgi:hypothetical protein